MNKNGRPPVCKTCPHPRRTHRDATADCECCRAIPDLCVFIHTKSSGGKKGATCGKPEELHCKARRLIGGDEEHHDDCQYAGRGGRKPMVHHTFHRRAA